MPHHFLRTARHAFTCTETGQHIHKQHVCQYAQKNINGCYSGNWNKWRLRGKETIGDECMAVQHTLEDKLVCGPVYLFSWITFISVIMFFLGYLSQHVLSVYTSMSVDMREQKWSTPVVVSGYSAEVIALQSMISWIGSVVPIFTGVFERKTSIKMAIFFHLFHFLLPSLLGYSPCSLAGQNVVVSISNRALMSITSPGVSPKIHTFCQSSGMESRWNGAEAGGREKCEEEVFKATGGLFPWGSVAGRLSPQIHVSLPWAEITRVCLNLQKRRRGPGGHRLWTDKVNPTEMSPASSRTT